MESLFGAIFEVPATAAAEDGGELCLDLRPVFTGERRKAYRRNSHVCWKLKARS
jgi:hypothetical protein